MTELLDNAFKFSAAGSAVEVRCRCDGPRVELRVSDRGRGLTPEQLAAIGAYMQFERKFYEQQGAGLGLTLARRLAELHGGSLTLRSKLGEGTTVTVTLPAVAASAG